jgi:two-component system, NarL family, response regulator LiaR
MGGRGRTAQGCESQPTNGKYPRTSLDSGVPPCLRCAFWQHFHHHPAAEVPRSGPLRVALVDSDPAAHEFVRETFKAHAKGWTLDSYHHPDSLLAALDPASRITSHASLLTHHVSRFIPTVILMEPHWLGHADFHHARELIARHTELRLVMFSARADSETIVESLMVGALGYLVKPLTPGSLLYTISEVAEGRVALGGQAQSILVDFARRRGIAQQSRNLTWRECEVMMLLLQGQCCKDISTKLKIHEGTVNRHLHDIYRKLRVHQKADAIRKFVGGGGEIMHSTCVLTSVQSLYKQGGSTELATYVRMCAWLCCAASES